MLGQSQPGEQGVEGRSYKLPKSTHDFVYPVAARRAEIDGFRALLEADAEEARRLAEAILEVKQEVHFCSRCFNYATADECSICQDSMRDTTRICVVGEPRDVQAIERTGSYHGLYHVLGGVISPMDKIGPEQLHIRELLTRLGHEDIHEVIIATNPNIEGETTASYLARTIKPLGVEVSRLASGLPVGGDLEYADELTLGRAIEARRTI